LGKISEAIRKFIDRLRGAANAAPVDAAQEKQPSPIAKFQTKTKPAQRDWKLSAAFKARPNVQQNTSHRKMMNH